MQVLKDLRKENKMSQQKLADIMHVSRSTIAMWETDASEPDIDNLKILARVFGVTIDYLLGREAVEQKESPAAVSGEAELDEELVRLLCRLDSPQEEQRVKDFVRGLLAAREEPVSPER